MQAVFMRKGERHFQPEKFNMHTGGIEMRCSIRILLTFLIILLCVSWVHAETFYASYPEGCIGCLNGMPVSDPVIGSIQLPAGTIELTYDTRVTPRRVLNIVCGPDDFSFKGFDTRYPNDWFAIPGEIITRSGTPKRDGDPDGICGIDGEQHVVHTVTRLKLEKPITLEIRINPIVDTQGAWYQYAQQKEITISYKVLSEPGSTTTSPPASKTGEGCDGGFVQEGINHEWNDYGTPTPANSVCECASLCKNDPQCVVVTYYRGKCYLKTATKPVVAPADANAASWVKGSTTTSPSGSQTVGNCDGGTVQEGINHEWIDYGTPTPANSVCECASLCKNDPQCVVVTYYRGKCYLKTATNPVVAPADANAASWVKGYIE